MSSMLLFGASCLDYIAQVDHFPRPDEKLRTESLTICGGGNAGNTATCLSRLGIKLKIMSKIGTDVNGEKILKIFQDEENIDTALVLVRSSTISPLTYIIVDNATKTRTCLYSATNEQILIDDIRSDYLDEIKFIHFDSRSTEAAVYLAKLARTKSIICSLDLERHRPFLNELIPFMDYIITTENYSRNVCKDSSLIETAVRFLQTCRQFVIITRGENGSVLVEKFHENSPITHDKVSQVGSVVTHEIVHVNEEIFIVWKCSAWPIQREDIVDTTGSGDAFIGAIIYGLLKQESWSRDKLLCFASYVATCKLRGVGARSRLPYLSDIDMTLFA